MPEDVGQAHVVLDLADVIAAQRAPQVRAAAIWLAEQGAMSGKQTRSNKKYKEMQSLVRRTAIECALPPELLAMQHCQRRGAIRCIENGP